MTRFNRYKTEASRAYERSLYCLKTIKKIQRDEERWQFHLEAEKTRIAILIERHEIFKARYTAPPFDPDEMPPDFGEEQGEATAAASPDSTNPSEENSANPPEPPPPPSRESVGQTLFVGVEKGKSVIYETTPSNADLRNSITPNTQIVRTYNFVGSVPPDYQHLLTADAYSSAKAPPSSKPTLSKNGAC